MLFSPALAASGRPGVHPRPFFIGSTAVSSYDSFEANQLKHMEMIQAVVARLAGNSFLIKGWAITLAGAFSGFGLNSDNPWLVAAGVLPIVFFWVIDTHFLKTERLFRALYDQVRTRDPDVEPFFMAAASSEFVARVREGKTGCDAAVASWRSTARRGVLVSFYGTLLSATLLVALITWLGSEDSPDEKEALLRVVAGVANAVSNAL